MTRPPLPHDLSPDDRKQYAEAYQVLITQGVSHQYAIKQCDYIFGRPSSPDVVNHPPHYTSHPSGVECIEIVEHLNFCVGNAIKYLWRAGLKGDDIQDLEKARWYVDREIKRRNEEAQR